MIWPFMAFGWLDFYRGKLMCPGCSGRLSNKLATLIFACATDVPETKT